MGMFDLSLQHLRVALVVLVTATACAWSPARAQAQLTIVDGEATLLDGNRNLAAVEGLKVGDETLVRTTARTSLLRVEWPDGSAADFGPDTQAMLNPRGFGTRGGRTPSVYLLSGWLKLSSMGSGPSAGLLTPQVDVQPYKGALVVMVAGDETWVYAESGGAPLVERHVRPASNLALKGGEVYLRVGAAKGAVATRPTPPQMQRVPRGFRDSLPLRSAVFKDKTVAGKAAPVPSYADLRDWLVAETPVRRTFTRRFAERSRDNDFRAGLVQNLGRHPEWERVLFPERFLPPASAPR